MAEAMLRAMLCEKLGCELEELRDRGYEVLSAGIHTMNGLTASLETIEVLTEQGIELRNHSSQPLSRQLLEAADTVYAMTKSHESSILAHWPEYKTRVELLSRDGKDISDPIGMGIDEYRRCQAEIAENLRQILDRI